MTHHTILRFPDVQAKTGIPRSTCYLRITQGLFPHPIKLGPRAAGWPENEIDALNRAHIAGLGEEQIRALVVRLEAQRKQAA